MLKTRRIQQIQDYVFKKQTASLDELVQKFNVSKNTIRRDIQELVERGDFKKVYGGVAVNHATLVSFNDRQTRHQLEKKQIAKIAAGYVADGDIIFIDSGTTTVEMFPFLKTKHLTIMTNNLDFINQALPFENLNVFSTGGVLERKTKSFVSHKSTEALQAYNINKAFMAATGVSLSNGVTNSSPLESEIKRTVVARSSKVFLLVDHDKFDKYALMTYCGMGKIDYLITDQPPGKDYQDYAKANDLHLIITNQ
ncbi:DeoR/GlpR transcriptional regulator [Sporolactobacillus sp. THM7-7]|nr:DeoR/GlpR transcriptional regulator [Sporolactobacillus sp. THM7-7]